ncbi:MAG: hydroxymethylbilane synthase [Acidobacteria bacterium]|nr:hydroxymethylbilane synthase [Acidobacteriota bacterium]
MLTIGSRGSKLALWQANWVKARLEDLGCAAGIEIIKTSGDQFQHGPLKEIGNKGLFTKEIEEALLDGRIDLAVHSLKDMPAAVPAGLQIAATPEREDARDVIAGSRLADLKIDARIGTSSIRRIAQLYAWRADLIIEPLRGNVDTRLRKLDEGQFDAIILAAAGLHRLGWRDRITEYLPASVMCPAIGQGALAIETRNDDGEASRVCRQLDHFPTRAAVTAERAMLTILGGGCQVPVGAHATVDGDQLHLRAIVATPDGRRLLRAEISGSVTEARHLGGELGKKLLVDGAGEILHSVFEAPV